jgi:hypothetical protein
MKRIVAAAAMLATLAGPAYAQFSTGKQKTPLELQYEREQRDQAQAEKEYNATMKRLKAQSAAPTNSDPWRGVRPSTDASAKR